MGAVQVILLLKLLDQLFFQHADRIHWLGPPPSCTHNLIGELLQLVIVGMAALGSL
ncbi:hypothetical protein D3C85_1494570 [compost metagenome]